MRIVPLAIPAAAMLLASACSPEPAPPQENVVEEAAAADLAMIPARYQGEWDEPGGNCAPGSQLQLIITDDTITYYESVGEVSAVAALDADAIELTLAMSGEGESWEQSETLRLLNADTTLMTAGAEDMLRERCQ